MTNIDKTDRAPRATSSRTVTIVGAGRVGQTLGRMLGENGFRIDTVICRSRAKAAAARKFTGARLAGTSIDEDAFHRSAIVLITTPDGLIRKTADEMARLRVDWKKKIVFHTSGALTSQELRALKRRGAHVASLHPLQTFPSPAEGIKALPGICFTFEGDANAQPTARRLVCACGGRLVKIQARHKALYHCAGFFACGGLLAPLSGAFMLYRKIGINARTAERMLTPMVRATLEGAHGENWAKSITGPISRGDANTVGQHLSALAQAAPELLKFYKSVSLHLLSLISRDLSPTQVKAIRKLLIH